MSTGASDGEYRTLTGGEALATMLLLHGARLMFGMAGFQLLPYYDALFRSSPNLRHVLIKDERDGAFMADAFARVSGTPGVCDGTLGPGALNLITGLAESHGAGVPVIALAGEVNALIAGRGATQEVDQWSMIRPTVKEAIQVECVERLPEHVRRAYLVATSGRAGPVLLNVRENVAHAAHDFPVADLFAPDSAFPARRIRPDPGDVAIAADLLRAAERPIVLAGGGIHLSGAYAEIQQFVDVLQVPLATTISGKGAIPENHELALGVFGRFSRTANDLIARSDCIIVVGCKLGEIATSRWTVLPPSVPVIQLDIDPEALGKTARIAVGLWCDALLGLRDLRTATLADIEGSTAITRETYVHEVKERKESWSTTHMERRNSKQVPIHQARMLNELARVLPDDSILVADGGFAAHWSAVYYDVPAAGRHYIANRGNASIGYGLPGAIGAKLAAPERVVVGLTGDGGLSMSIAELETAVRERANIIVMVVDNQSQGYVKALQHSMYEGRFQSCEYGFQDYARIAAEFGVRGERVEDPDELVPALRRAIEVDEPYLLDVVVTREASEMLPGVDARSKTSQGAVVEEKALVIGHEARGESRVADTRRA